MFRNSLFRLCSTTPLAYLRYSAQVIHQAPHLNSFVRLNAIKTKAQKKLLTDQPYLLQQNFSGKIVYSAWGITPEEALTQGGITNKGKPCVLSTDTGYNDGCVAFSLLPQIASIFYDDQRTFAPHKQVYLYAFPLFGNFICPGKAWYEVISPSAFPLPNWWLARKIEKVHHNGKVELGPLLGQFGRVPALEKGEDFHHFINNTIALPDLHYTGESMVFDVDGIATKYAREFKDKVSKHYEEAAPKRYPAYRP